VKSHTGKARATRSWSGVSHSKLWRRAPELKLRSSNRARAEVRAGPTWVSPVRRKSAMTAISHDGTELSAPSRKVSKGPPSLSKPSKRVRALKNGLSSSGRLVRKIGFQRLIFFSLFRSLLGFLPLVVAMKDINLNSEAPAQRSNRVCPGICVVARTEQTILLQYFPLDAMAKDVCGLFHSTVCTAPQIGMGWVQVKFNARTTCSLIDMYNIELRMLDCILKDFNRSHRSHCKNQETSPRLRQWTTIIREAERYCCTATRSIHSVDSEEVTTT